MLARFGGFRTGVAQHSILMKYVPATMGNWLSTFQWELNALETSLPERSLAESHTSEEWNLQHGDDPGSHGLFYVTNPEFIWRSWRLLLRNLSWWCKCNIQTAQYPNIITQYHRYNKLLGPRVEYSYHFPTFDISSSVEYQKRSCLYSYEMSVAMVVNP